MKITFLVLFKKQRKNSYNLLTFLLLKHSKIETYMFTWHHRRIEMLQSYENLWHKFCGTLMTNVAKTLSHVCRTVWQEPFCKKCQWKKQHDKIYILSVACKTLLRMEWETYESKAESFSCGTIKSVFTSADGRQLKYPALKIWGSTKVIKFSACYAKKFFIAPVPSRKPLKNQKHTWKRNSCISLAKETSTISKVLLTFKAEKCEKDARAVRFNLFLETILKAYKRTLTSGPPLTSSSTLLYHVSHRRMEWKHLGLAPLT